MCYDVIIMIFRSLQSKAPHSYEAAFEARSFLVRLTRYQRYPEIGGNERHGFSILDS
jgi:hypothetical protein